MPDQHQLDEVLVWFGAKKVANPNDTVYIKIYGVNHATGGPDTLMGISYPVKMSHIVNSASSNQDSIYTDFLLQQPITFTDSFFVSVVLPNEKGDTVGIISNSNRQAMGTRLCWIKSSGGSWSAIEVAHAFEIDAVIFPLVGDAPSGIDEQSSPVASANAYPNPANEKTAIDYWLAKAVPQIRFTVVDISVRLFTPAFSATTRWEKTPSLLTQAYYLRAVILFF